MNRSRGVALLLSVLLLWATPAHASTGGSAPVSPTGRIVSQAPVPLTSEVPLPLAAPVDTEVFWTRWTSRLVYGTPALIEGQVLVSDGALPEARVNLYVRPEGWTRWKLVRSTVSSAETGVFAFDDHRPSRNSDYRVTYQGNLLYASSAEDKPVRVYRRVPDSMVRLADGTFSLRGSVAPSYKHRQVQLQRKKCKTCKWWTIDKTSTTDRSRWAFRVTGPRTSGTWYYRARVPGSSWFLTSYGDHVWYLTRR